MKHNVTYDKIQMLYSLSESHIKLLCIDDSSVYEIDTYDKSQIRMLLNALNGNRSFTLHVHKVVVSGDYIDGTKIIGYDMGIKFKRNNAGSMIINIDPANLYIATDDFTMSEIRDLDEEEDILLVDLPNVARMKKIYIDLPHDNNGVLNIHYTKDDGIEIIYGIQLGYYDFSFKKNIEDRTRFNTGVYKIMIANVNHDTKKIEISKFNIPHTLLLQVLFTDNQMIVQLTGLEIDCTVVIDRWEFKHFERKQYK